MPEPNTQKNGNENSFSFIFALKCFFFTLTIPRQTLRIPSIGYIVSRIKNINSKKKIIDLESMIPPIKGTKGSCLI